MKERENLFEKKGYIDVPYKPLVSSTEVREMLGLWKDFCLLPLEEKMHHVPSLAGGYEYKGLDSDSGEYKQFFHYSSKYEMPQTISLTEKSFLTYAAFFLEKLIPVVEFIGTHMNWVASADMSKLMVKDPSRWTLRFLHYPPADQPLDEIRAASHVDKAFTIHITETAHGLQILWKGKGKKSTLRWRNIAPKRGHFLAYAGLIGQYYSGSKVPAVCHRVVNSPKTSSKGRFSIVLFTDFGNVAYDKARFGRTQEQFPSGENYDMSFREFRSFFTEAENKIL